MLLSSFTLLLISLTAASALPSVESADGGIDVRAKRPVQQAKASCFPALDFVMPSTTPTSLDGWWCNASTEYGFLGFSYEVSQCQSLTKLRAEFKDIKTRFKGRYVRLYGACDRTGFYDDVVDAAWTAGIGVHALIWFGFDGDNAYVPRRNALLGKLHSNPRAKFVTRLLQFGSEPLYDWVLPISQLKTQVLNARTNLSSLKIPVTLSEMAWGFQSRQDEGSLDLLANLDSFNLHTLPFFAQTASIANNSWPIVRKDLDWFIAQNTKGKKMYFAQNGWPCYTRSGIEPNSPDAVANVKNEGDYYRLMDSKCEELKAVIGGGVGWFAHLYSDNQDDAYGVLNTAGNPKFPFSPRTSC